MTAEYLPLEIITLILENVALGGATPSKELASCALTCKQWSHAAAPMQFRTIIIRDQFRYIKAYRLFMITSPHLRQFVRRLELASLRLNRPISSNMTIQQQRWIQNANFVEFARSFQQIDDLSVTHLDISSPMMAPAVTSHRVKQLRLGSFNTTSTELLHILRALSPTLRLLHLYALEQRAASSSPDDLADVDNSSSVVRLDSLHTLTVVGCSIRIIPSRLEMPNLRTYRTMLSETSLADCVPEQLEQMVAKVPPGGNLNDVGLTENRHIVRDLNLLWFPKSASMSDIVTTIHAITLYPGKIERISFFIYRPTSSRAMSSTSPELDHLLSGLCQDGALHCVTFWDRYAMVEGNVWFQTQLPKVHKLGKLHYRVGVPESFNGFLS